MTRRASERPDRWVRDHVVQEGRVSGDEGIVELVRDIALAIPVITNSCVNPLLQISPKFPPRSAVVKTPIFCVLDG